MAGFRDRWPTRAMALPAAFATDPSAACPERVTLIGCFQGHRAELP
jgi:hypothetical protein